MLTYHFPTGPEALNGKLLLGTVRGVAEIGIPEGRARRGAQEGERRLKGFKSQRDSCVWSFVMDPSVYDFRNI